MLDKPDPFHRLTGAYCRYARLHLGYRIAILDRFRGNGPVEAPNERLIHRHPSAICLVSYRIAKALGGKHCS